MAREGSGRAGRRLGGERPSFLEVVRRQATLASHRIQTLPILVLSPHSRCNCRCVMCDIWQGNTRLREIDLERVDSLVEDLERLGTRWVVLTGGEPLMHRQVDGICERLRARGMSITLLSTGLLLGRVAAEVGRWVDEVIVSLDGPAQVHDRIRRVPRAFERLAAGVAAVREISPELPISARSVVQRENFRHLVDTVDAAREIGLDRISFLAADVASEAFNRPGGWSTDRASEVALSVTEVEELAGTVELLLTVRKEQVEAGFVVERPEKLRRLVAYYRAMAGDGELPPVRCNAPWVSAVVEADGAVRPCFFHPAYGSLDEGRLPEILDSAAAIAFRRGLDVATDPICRRCVCSLELRPWAPVP